MEAYRSLSLLQLIEQIEELMPRLIEPVFGRSLPLARMVETVNIVELMVEAVNRTYDAHNEFMGAYATLQVCHSLRCGTITIPESFITIPTPPAIKRALKAAISQGEVGFGAGLVADGPRQSFREALTVFEGLPDCETQAGQLPDIVERGCMAVNLEVAALAGIGRAFQASLDCRTKILTHHGRVDERSTAGDRKSRVEIARAITVHRQLRDEMEKIW